MTLHLGTRLASGFVLLAASHAVAAPSSEPPATATEWQSELLVPEGEHFTTPIPSNDPHAWMLWPRFKLTPDRKFWLCAADHALRLLDARSGATVKSFDGRWGHVPPVFNADARLAAVAGETDVVIVDTTTWNELKRVERVGKVRSLSFGGQSLLAVVASERSFLWDPLKDSQRELEFPADEDGSFAPHSVRLSPDGTRLAAEAGTRLRVLDSATGSERWRTKTAKYHNFFGSMFVPGGRLITSESGTTQNTMRVWELESGRELPGFDGFKTEKIVGIEASRDGELLLAHAADRSLVLINARSLLEIRRLGKGDAATFGPNNEVSIAEHARAVRHTGRVEVFEPRTGLRILETPRFDERVIGMAMSPDGRLLAAADANDVARIWDVREGKLIRLFRPEAEPTGSGTIRWSANGELVAIAGQRHVVFWDWRSGVIKTRVEVPSVSEIALTPDGKTLLVSMSGQAIGVYDLGTGQYVTTHFPPQGTHSMRGLTVSPDGRLFAYVSRGVQTSKVITVDLASVALRSQFDSSYVFEALAFSPDGRSLGAAGSGGTQIWDLASGRRLHDLPDPRATLQGIAFSGDGRTLATGVLRHEGNIVRTWNLADNKRIADQASPGVHVAFTGNTVIAAGARIRIFSEPGQSLRASNEGWAAQRGEQLLRHDLGTLLFPTGTDGQLAPAPPRAATEATLTARFSTSPTALSETEDCKPGQVEVEITNSGSERAYWVRIETEAASGLVIEATPTLQRLEPGAKTNVPVRYARLGKAGADTDQPLDLSLRIVDAQGERARLTEKVPLLAPRLRANSARISEQGAKPVVLVALQNAGSASAKQVEIEALLVRDDRVVTRTAGQFPLLDRGQEATLQLPIPEQLWDGAPFSVRFGASDGVAHGWSGEFTGLSHRPRNLLVWVLLALPALLVIALLMRSRRFRKPIVGAGVLLFGLLSAGRSVAQEPAPATDLAEPLILGGEPWSSPTESVRDPRWRASWSQWTPDRRRRIVQVTPKVFLMDAAQRVIGTFDVQLYSRWHRLNPAGSILAITSSKEGVARFFDTDNAAEIGTLEFERHDTPVYTLGVNKQLAALQDGTIRVWESPGGSVLHEIPLPKASRSSFDKSRGGFKGHLVLAAGVVVVSDDAEVFGIELSSGRELWRESASKLPRKFDINLDGTKLLGGIPSGAIVVCDVRTGQRTGEYFDPGVKYSAADRVDLSPDGALLSAAGGQTITVWDTHSGKVLKHYAGRTGSFGTGGELLVESAVIDPRTGVHYTKAAPKPTFVRSVAATRDGRLLATTGGQVRIWDLPRRQLLRALRDTKAEEGEAHFLADNRTLALLGADVLLYDVIEDLEKRRIQLPVSFKAISQDGSKVVAVSSNCSLQVFDIAHEQPGAPIPPPELASECDKVVLSADGRHVAHRYSSGSRGLVALRDLTTNRLQVLDSGLRHISSLAFAPDGRTLAIGSPDKTELWNVAHGRRVREIIDVGADNARVAFSPDGRKLVTAVTTVLHDGWSSRVWDVALGTQLEVLPGAGRAFAFAGDALVSAGNGAIIAGATPSHIQLNADGWVFAQGDRIVRHDIGTLLLPAADSTGLIAPKLPPASEATLVATVSEIKPILDTEGGGAGQVQIEVRNQGPRTAYWVHVEADVGQDIAVEGPTLQKLEPSASAQLTVKVASPRHVLVPGPFELRLKVVDAHDLGTVVKAQMDWKVPFIFVSRTEWKAEAGARRVVFDIKNAGTAKSGPLNVEARLVRDGKVFAQAEVVPPSLNIGETKTATIAVPETLVDGHDFALVLRARDAPWRSHQWQHISSPLRAGVSTLQYAFASGVLVVFASVVALRVRRWRKAR